MTSNSKSDALSSFLQEVRTCGADHSHVLVGAPFGRINVTNGRMNEFWKLYSSCVESEPNAPLYLAERPLSELPVLVDVDLKTRTAADVARRLYSEEQLLTVVRAYQTILKDKVLESATDDNMTCVLLEKDPYVVDINGTKFIKNGFHLHFPKCFVSVAAQEAYVFPIAKKQLCGLFDNLYESVDGQHYEFIDSNSLKVHWLLYGSKKPNRAPYVATRCFSNGAEEISLEDGLSDYVLPKLCGELESPVCSGRVHRMLPRILSTRLHGRERYYCKEKPSVSTPIFEKMFEDRAKRHAYEQTQITANLTEVQRLVDLLSDERADERSDWINIGFCLWNVSKGDDEGLMIWLAFSERSEKYSEAECIRTWNAMRPSAYTIGTLKHFAKIDNPVEYEKICKRSSDALLDKAVEGGHNDLAKLLYTEYGEEFIYSPSNDSWYRFGNHIWERNKGKCFDLSERISDNHGVIISRFEERIRRVKQSLRQLPERGRRRRRRDGDDDESESESESAKLENQISVLNKLIKQCKTAGFKESVMKECKEVFRNTAFVDYLNTNPYLVAFKNGVYDFKNFYFRDGNPEDYLSKQLPIEYKNYGSVDHPDVMEVDGFFRKVLVDDLVRGYFLDQICQLFIGGNEEKVLLIWTGTGDNGKSVTQRLFEKMLGPLAVKTNTSLITGKKTQMGQAAPELARTGNGVRWLVMDEPSQDEEITTGLLKSLTGNDSYWARDLYQGGEDTKEIVPLYKMHMLCNKLPGIRNPDDAFWERIKIIPFESKFIAEKNCPTTYEERVARKLFPKDGKFNSKADALLQPLAWYLIDRLKNLRPDRVEPDAVKIATDEYRDDHTGDPRQEFIDEYLVRRDGTGRVDVAQLYDRYKSWFKAEYRNEKAPVKKSVLNALDKILGKRSGNVWQHWEWKADAEDANRRVNPMLT